MAEENQNERYQITEFPVSGDLAELGTLIPYKSGNGFLREVVVRCPVGFHEAKIPITVFGEDATNVGETDIGRTVECTAKLQSRKYTDRNGNPRWSLQLTANGFRVTGAAPVPQDQQPDPLATDPDDIPF